MKRLNVFIFIPIFLVLLITACGGDGDKSQPLRPSEEFPAHLKGEQWLTHLKEDLLPYWTMDEAKGQPQGNFPTTRGMDGRILTKDRDGNDLTTRVPRMLARQVYVYAMGYMLTGDGFLLQLAKDGCDWLIEHAWDNEHGGWFAILEKSGRGQPDKVKYAQDTSYVAQAFAAYYFVTRDPDIEKYIIKTRDLVFSKYWDGENKRVYDGLSADMTKEVDQGDDSGWELVAQLDQINAFMMLSQPVLSQPDRAEQFLQDMKTLADTIVKHFLKDGIFWGIHNNKGKFDTRHVDFGHTLKSYWMLMQLDKRLPGNPYKELVNKQVHRWLKLAYDTENGAWGDKMLQNEKGELYAKYGSLWWSYAELDQVAATLNMAKPDYTHILDRTAKTWLDHFVDKQYKEVIFGIKPDKSRGWDWKADDMMKCFFWKNGFHSVEHAVVMYIHGKAMEKKPVELYYAVAAPQTKTFIARPYIFDGTETGRAAGKSLLIDGKPLIKVKVTFEHIN